MNFYVQCGAIDQRLLVKVAQGQTGGAQRLSVTRTVIGAAFDTVALARTPGFRGSLKCRTQAVPGLALAKDVLSTRTLVAILFGEMIAWLTIARVHSSS